MIAAATKEKADRLLVVGGGAAGFFAAIAAAEANPEATVKLIERGRRCLSKVKISGGGRCNVTHDCFDPRELSTGYPRGERELLGPLSRFQPADTLDWFERRGVELKAEADGRMFPVTDSSQTVIDALEDAARKAGVIVRTGCGMVDFAVGDGEPFTVKTSCGERLAADRFLLAVGGLREGKLTDKLRDLGHTVTPLAPSLFTFNIPNDPRLEGLAGVSVPDAEAEIPRLGKTQRGPVLITHWGLSGPGILKLSAWGARELQDWGYRFDLRINWTTQPKVAACLAELEGLCGDAGTGRSQVSTRPAFGLPRRLWARLVEHAGIPRKRVWRQLTRGELGNLARELTAGTFAVDGKSTNKEEFVTCGGVALSEIDFKKMESRLVPGLHFAGETLDIDGITGGFNFQNAWTTGWLAGRAMAGPVTAREV